MEAAGLQSEPDRRMQADSDDSSDVVAKFSTKLSSLFTQKPLWTLGSFRIILFTSEFIYPRESRRRKWKRWRWMRRPTAHFENTVLPWEICLLDVFERLESAQDLVMMK